MFTQHGDTKYIFSFAATGDAATEAAAIEAATGIAPQELSISGEAEFVAEAAGADGTVGGLAIAPDKHTFTLSGYLVDLAAFEAEGVAFSHGGRDFFVTGRQLTKAGKEFQKAQMSGVSYAGVDAASSS
jgi:hypothetical protein